jgi:hypothetical protein
VPNDPCRRLGGAGAPRRFHLLVRHAPSRCGRVETPSTR